MKGPTEMNTPINILHLEDDATDAKLVQTKLKTALTDCRITFVQTGPAFEAALRRGGFDIILSDYNLPGYDGLEALQLSQELHPEVPFVFVSGALGEDAAIECLTQGATDYVLKQKLSRLVPAVERALREAEVWEERRSAQELLAVSEARFRSIVETTPDMVWEITPEGFFSYISPQFEATLGYNPATISGKRILDLIAPEEVPLARWQFEGDVADKQKLDSFEITALHRETGERVQLEIRSVPVLSETGALMGFRGFARNITERRQIEQTLHENERLLSDAQEIAHLGSWVYDQTTKELHSSPEVYHILGESPDRGLEYEDFMGFIYPPDQVKVRQARLDIQKNRQPIDIEYRILRPDGELRYLSERNVGRYNKEGELTQLIGSVLDITTRKVDEKELNEKQAALNAIVESSQDWIWTMDAQGMHTYSNPAVESILGYRPEELTDKINLGLLHEQDSQKIQSLLPECRQKKDGWSNLLLRWRHKDGSYRCLESSAVPILNERGDLRGFHGVDRDVTERTQAQENSSLEHANYQKIFAAIPIGIVLIDSERKVSLANQPAADIVLRDPVELIGRRAGGGLQCIHSLENPKGCGFGPECPECPLRLGVESVLVEGEIIHGAEIDLTLLIDGKPQPRRIRINAEPLDLNGKRYALVAIDDITG
jgi:PAS domain S-box-containing protein